MELASQRMTIAVKIIISVWDLLIGEIIRLHKLAWDI
jgi:hypothetical protein